MNKTAKITILILTALLLISLAFNISMAIQNKTNKALLPEKGQMDSIKNATPIRPDSIKIK